MGLADDLGAFFGGVEGRRVVLVGIGSPIRGDDAVGLRVIELLEGMKLGDVLLLSTEIVPESYTGKIREFKPTHVLMIDAADFNGEPGEGRMIPTQQIGGVTMSTHSLPLTIFVDYLRKTLCSNVALLGVQSQNIGFGTGLTPEVEEGAQKIAKVLYEVLR
jgi:hydrogenase 3 maturation protease